MSDDLPQRPSLKVIDFIARTSQPERAVGGSGTGDGVPPISPDLVNYRLDQNDKALTALEGRAQSIEATVNRIESKLDSLATKAEVAALPTKDSFRNWNLALIVAVIATLLSMTGLFLASAANQLSAFSAVLSAVQAAIAFKPPVP